MKEGKADRKSALLRLVHKNIACISNIWALGCGFISDPSLPLVCSWGVAAEEEHVLLLLHDPIPRAVAKSISNINNAKVMTPGAVNLYDILRADKLVVTKSMLQHLNERYPPKSALADEDGSEEEAAPEAAPEAAEEAA